MRDGLLTDLEATVGTYELRSYGGEQKSKLGNVVNRLAVFQVDIGVE